MGAKGSRISQMRFMLYVHIPLMDHLALRSGRDHHCGEPVAGTLVDVVATRTLRPGERLKRPDRVTKFAYVRADAASGPALTPPARYLLGGRVFGLNQRFFLGTLGANN
jgi:hypothetical protein